MVASYWFTEEDKDLIGSRSTRDPLGFLPIWSQRGRAVVPNLTEQTVEARGFQLLVTTLNLWQDFQSRNPQVKIRVEEFFLLVEQAFAFSVQSRSGQWPLPGRERVVKFTPDQARLWLKRGILDNQLGNGIWGLYRGAAFRSNILHDSLRRLSDAFYHQMGDKLGLDGRQRNKLFNRVLAAVTDHREVGEEFNLHGSRGLPNQLDEILKKMPQKALLRRHLLPSESLVERVAQLLYEHRKAFWNDGSFRRIFIELCIKQFPQEKEVFEQILLCENFIAPVERVFRYLFRFVGQPISKVVTELDIDLKLFKGAFDGFCDSGKYTGGTFRRFTIYKDGIQLSSKEDFICSILACHLKVATDRHREPWVTFENGKIQAFSQESGPEELDATPGRTWNNDYYLRPLLSVYTGVRQ